MEIARTTGPSLLFVATVAATAKNFLAAYAGHFRALGWRVDVAANGVIGDEALRNGFDNVYELPLSRSIFDLKAMVKGERALAEVLRSEPDIVHAHTPIASFIARVAVRQMPADRRPKIAYTAHGFHFHNDGRFLTNTLFRTAERVAGRWTDRLIVINDEDFKSAQSYRIVPRSRLVRMPGIGIDTDNYLRSRIDPIELVHARQALEVGADAPLFVVVGELNRNKRCADVIVALSLMRRTDVHLVFAGDGPDHARLQSRAIDLGLADRVSFAGFVDDVRPLVADATAVVLASKREGLARSIMEALALEVPVVASTARGNRELVGDDGGIVVPIGNVRAMAEAMDWLIDHPTERRQMGVAGRSRMVAEYDLTITFAKHEQLYRELLAERDGAGL